MTKAAASPIGVEDGDILPVVRVEGSFRSPWIFAAIMGGCAMLMFYLLEARRETASTTTTESLTGPSVGRISSPPELFIPRDDTLNDSDLKSIRSTVVGYSGPLAQTARREGQIETPTVQAYTRPPRYAPPNSQGPIPYAPPLPQMTYESGVARPIPTANSVDPASQQDRVKAFRFANPATTVPKGAIIEAALETALDSTRPGFVRAIVGQDVFGFDGSRVLIPKGSRLIGEYKSDLAAGQNRALIQWQRLMRPDGVVINLDSPAIDPLGRAGVRGHVDSHFFERLAGAFLQTVVSIGSQAVLNAATGDVVIYAAPVAGQIPQNASSDRVQRTLKVKQGASVSVFVVKDLDFTTVEP